MLERLRQHAAGLETEIAERKRAEADLQYAAFHDDLTKLHNRAFFMGQCILALQRVGISPGRRPALLTLDLDCFKLVNDSLGHRAGDVLLSDIAERLRTCAGNGSTLARIGGDEFAMLVDDLDEPGMRELAGRILEETGRPFWFEGRQGMCSASLGVAWIDERYGTAEQVLRDADLAMYEAKRDGPGQYRLFDKTMRQGAFDALALATGLSNASRDAQLVVHYQPICDVRTGAIAGVEALVRWRHPEHGLLGPGSFIAAAEERGLIRDIGRFVLAEGSRQLRRWRDLLPDLELVLHVNLSGTELKDPELVRHTAEALRNAGIGPSALQFEITEGVFLNQPAQARAVLADLRRSGVRIALDDFGTGFSSLGFLDQYEVDTIKIDRAFVARLPDGPRTRAVVAAIFQLGKALDVEVVAEGVETPEQLGLLVAAGCALVQGYLLGRPADAASITAALERQAAGG